MWTAVWSALESFDSRFGFDLFHRKYDLIAVGQLAEPEAMKFGHFRQRILAGGLEELLRD